jgi:hypothetical protein
MESDTNNDISKYELYNLIRMANEIKELQWKVKR